MPREPLNDRIQKRIRESLLGADYSFAPVGHGSSKLGLVTKDVPNGVNQGGRVGPRPHSQVSIADGGAETVGPRGDDGTPRCNCLAEDAAWAVVFLPNDQYHVSCL